MIIKHLGVDADFGAHKFSLGTLAVAGDGKIYFEYADAALAAGLDFSPFEVPLRPGLHMSPRSPFEGLQGLFADSLPDGWGRLLLDRQWRALGRRGAPSPLTRLASVGHDGLGVLKFTPQLSDGEPVTDIHLEDLAQDAAQILNDSQVTDVEAFLHLGGSSGGARPKVRVWTNADRSVLTQSPSPACDQAWIIKFPGHDDPADIGAIEYAYWHMAKRAGLSVPDAHLFDGRFFGVRRFDVDGSGRLHMHSAAGLLHADYRTPALDYQDLIRLTFALTRHMDDVKAMYRLCVVNVLSHNRDDHAKIFAYLMDSQGQWRLSPAYDLTFSHGVNFEQSTMVMGEGRNINSSHLHALAEQARIPSSEARDIIAEVIDALDQWPDLARRAGVTANSCQLLHRALGQIQNRWQD